MTYAEYRMQKVAEGDEENQPKNWYDHIREQAEAGDEKAKEVLARTPQSAVGWGLLGAGLGAGGGYLLSRWLRRSGTKRQRALDMLIGALLGGGGAWLTLNSFKGPEGLTWMQQQAVDEYKRETGHGDEKSRPDPVPGPDPIRRTVQIVTGGLGALGGGIGGAKGGAAIGRNILPYERLYEMKGYQAAQKEIVAASKAKHPMPHDAQVQLRKDYMEAGRAKGRALDSALGGTVGGLALGVGGGAVGAWGGGKLYDWTGLGHQDESTVR